MNDYMNNKIKHIINNGGFTISLEQYLEYSYIILFALYIFRGLIWDTLFIINWPVWYDSMIRFGLINIIFARFFLTKITNKKMWLLSMIIGIPLILSWKNTGYIFLADLWLIIAAGYNVDYKKVLKAYIIVVMPMVFAAFVGSMTGVIRDLTYIRGGGRHSFGWIYPTDLATHVLFLLFVLAILYDGMSTLFMAAVMCVYVFVMKRYCDARCSSLIAVFSIIGIVYVKIIGRYGGKKFFCHISKIVDVGSLFVVPAVSCMMLISMVIYREDNKLLVMLNNMLSYRLMQAKTAYMNYGIKAFGTAFELIGNGGREDVLMTSQEVNFVDSSYCLIAIRYGYVVLLTIIILWMFFIYRCIRKNDRMLALVALLIIIHSVIEQHLIEVRYVPFYAVMFSKYIITGEKKQTEYVKKSWQPIVISAASLGILTAASAVIFSYIRTLTTILNLHEESKHKYFLAICSVFFLSLLIAYKFIFSYVLHKKRLTVIMAAIIMATDISGLAVLFIYVRNQIDDYVVQVESAMSVVESTLGTHLSEFGEYNLYADDLPVYYHMLSYPVKYTIKPASWLVLDKNNIVITSVEEDNYTAFHYLQVFYGRLTDDNSIYVPDQKTNWILKLYGGIDTDICNNAVHSVDMNWLAYINHLSMQDGMMIVDGPYRSLIYGPYYELNGAGLMVRFKIRLLGKPGDITKKLATLRLSGNYGHDIWLEKDIYYKDFLENDVQEFVIETDTHHAIGVEMLVFAENGVQLGIENIEYKKKIFSEIFD